MRLAFVVCGVAIGALVVLAIFSGPPPPAGPSEPHPSGTAIGSPLVWHVERPDGEVTDSRLADEPINPASVTKLATTLWALEVLGPDHGFETRFGARGSIDPSSGTLAGDLVVVGSGDPDFHVENAFLVSREINALGIRSVSGSILVGPRFWIGWEGGSARRRRDGRRRGELMAERLRDAVEPGRWDRATREAMESFLERNALTETSLPTLPVRGAALAVSEPAPDRTLVVHRSNPLRETLRRFNAYSNNDIERLGDSLGSAVELAAFLDKRWGAAAEGLRFETLSGLGSNRMTPRQIVRLLRDLSGACGRAGIALGDVLPVAGCDPGTLEFLVPTGREELRGSITAKTGTLTTTDGGVVVLAGKVSTRQGELLFVVASSGTGQRPADARADQRQWLEELIERQGGARPVACGPPLPFSDHLARVSAEPRAPE